MADPLGNLLHKIKQLLEDNVISLPERESFLHKVHGYILESIQDKKNQGNISTDSQTRLVCDDGAAMQFPKSERWRAGNFLPVR